MKSIAQSVVTAIVLGGFLFLGLCVIFGAVWHNWRGK